MVSPGDMKSHLLELEDKKNKLQEEIRKATRRFKLSLWGVGIGVVLLPLALLTGIPVLLVAGIVAAYYTVKKTNYEDKLETIETEIHKLEISMA